MRRAIRSACVAAAVVLLANCAIVDAATAQDAALKSLQEEQRKIFEGVAPSVVFITHDNGFGSGFFVSSDGAILTNAHVVGDRKKVGVVLRDGRKATGKVVALADEKYDLALVRVPLDNTKRLKLAGMDQVRVGNWVASVGHGHGGIWTYTTGMISNIYPKGKERPVFQTQIPLNPGNSGGPIVDANGRAIGVVTAGVEGANNINFAIPTELALKHIGALSTNCDCLVIEAPKSQPIFVDGVMAGKGPRLVIPADKKEYQVMIVVDGKARTETISWPKTRKVDLRVPQKNKKKKKQATAEDEE